MKKSILISLILFILGFSYQTSAATYYVSPTGSSSNNGLTQGSAWSITHAFSSAVAGDIVYVRAGNYGNVNVSQSNSGTSGSLIQFIGCDNSFNPIVTINRATYTRTDVFSGNDIPYLNGGLIAGQRASNGRGITVSGSYVRVENFAIRGYEEGFRNSGSNCVFRNINTDFMGDMRADNANTSLPSRWNYYLGRSHTVFGTNNLIENCYHRDADSQGITISGDNNTFNHIEIYTSASCPNTTDYQFLFGASHNQCSDINIIREVGTLHLSHGIVIKPTSSIAEYNVVDGFYCENSKVEFQATTARFNTVKNGKLVNTSTSFSYDYAATMITMSNGANNNHLENIILFQPTWGIWFENWNENYPNNGNTVGDDNTFTNIICINPWSAHLGFRERNGNSNSTPKNINFYNMTFVGSNLFYNAQATGLATGGVYNSILLNVGMGNGASVISPSFVFDKVNTSLNVTQFAETNITNLAFSFVDPMSSTTDSYDYKPTSSILDIGTDYTATEPRQGYDFYVNTRTAPFTLGAVEFDSISGGCATTSSVINTLIDSGSTYSFNSQTLTSSGTYYDTLSNSIGCDSIITLNLSFNKVYEACKMNNSSQIIIDGVEETLWFDIDSVSLGKTFAGQSLPLMTDLSANYKAIWDSSSLYILVKVMDDIISSDGPSYIHDDAISIYIDGLNENTTNYDVNDHNIGLQYGTSVIIHNGITYSGLGITKSEIAISGGYQMEIKIDWSLIGITPSISNPIGIDIHVNDDDDGGNRDTKIMWNDESDLAYINPSKLGLLALSDNVCSYISQACKTPSPFTIDGIEEATWTTLVSYDIENNRVGLPVPSLSDLSANYKVSWDDSAMYFFINVTDDVIETADVSYVDDDAVQIYIDGGNEDNNSYDANDYNFAFKIGTTDIYRNGLLYTGNAVTKAEQTTGTGYVVEVKINWSAIGITYDTNNSIGIDVHVNDDDDGGARDGRIMWSDKEDIAYINPTVFGTLLLNNQSCYNTTNTNKLENNNVLIYPNPTNNLVVISSEVLIRKIEIYNMDGKRILQEEGLFKTHQINMTHVKNGNYIIKITNGNNTAIRRIVKTE